VRRLATREARARFVLAGVGALFAWLAFEIALRLAYPALPDGARTPLRRVRTWGIAGSRLGPEWTEHCVGDAYLGARNLPDLDGARVQFGPALYRVSTRSLGFDGVGFRTPEPATRWDAVVVGDSFAFCHHVDIAQCWVPQLARATGLTIANLAVPGTGSVSHARYLERYGRVLEPRLVIWQYWVNDPRDDFDHVVRGKLPCPRAASGSGRSARGIGLKRLLFDGSAGASVLRAAWRRATDAPRAPKRTNTWVFETTEGRPLFAWRGEGAAPESNEGAAGWALTLRALREASHESERRGAAFLLVIAPSNLQVYAEQLPDEPMRAEMRAENRVSDALVAFAAQHAIGVLDLRPAFRAAAAHGEDLYPRYDVHWTPAGNRLAASEIASWVRAALPNARQPAP